MEYCNQIPTFSLFREKAMETECRGTLVMVGDSHQKIVLPHLIFGALNMVVVCGADNPANRGYTSSSDWPNKK